MLGTLGIAGWSNEVRLLLGVIAYNLGNLPRQPAASTRPPPAYPELVPRTPGLATRQDLEGALPLARGGAARAAEARTPPSR